jgi:arylsulfatase A-like enzyme
MKVHLATRVLVAALLWMLAAAPAVPTAGRPPNILFILTDDQRWDALGCMGHPFLETPNIDRLAKEGALFRNAFVTTSLCSPSRASMLTGTYAHTHGVITNESVDVDLKRFASFPMILRDRAGYRTAFIGKWHMDAQTDEPRPGFDYWLSFRGQGDYDDNPLNENGVKFPSRGYVTDVLTSYAVQWLDENTDKPFCLVVSHKAGHEPCEPAPRHADAFEGARMPEPVSYDDSLAGKPAWQRAALSAPGEHRSSARASAEVPASLPPREFETTELEIEYDRCLLSVDESVGAILEKLTELGELDNTLILYSSDNGLFFGEHRRDDKRLAYEESMRIPVLVRGPRFVEPGTTIDEMVLNIDFAPTFLAAAGVQPPAAMQGRSMLPLFAAEKASWRESFLYEYFVDILPEIPRMEAVRTERWKYVVYPDIQDVPELYDLQNDPHELSNLALDPRFEEERKRMESELARLKEETGFRNVSDIVGCNKPMETVLSLDLASGDGNVVHDDSGHGNDGKRLGGKPTAAGLGFSGKDYITVPRSASLDPSQCPWAVEATFQASADGVVLAQGGDGLGYILFVQRGKPCFAVRHSGSLAIAEATKSCLGRWTHALGTIEGQRATLYVDGERVASISLMSAIPKNPNDSFQVGLDTSPLVYAAISSTGFQGTIRSVRAHRKSVTDADAMAMASASTGRR